MSTAARQRASGHPRSARHLYRLRLAFGFFTVLPLSRSGSISEVAESVYLLPAVGLVLGTLEGLAAWGSSRLFGSLVAGAVALASALLLTGLHHADGLADMGDAVMAHGNRRRLEVLKDRTMGIGAAGALLVTYLLTWAALAQLALLRGGPALIGVLAAAEVSARAALLLVAGLSRPSHPGSGSEFIRATKGRRGAAGFAATLVIMAALALPLGAAASGLALAGGILAAILVTVLAGRLFGGAGGDVLGATVELARLASLLALISRW